MKHPAVVNKFDTEQEAVEHAKAWSKERNETWTVIHGRGEKGLAYFAEKGDGGLIRLDERVVARFTGGKRDTD